MRFGRREHAREFLFHLSAPDQDFPDDIGSDVSDLAAAHSIAVRLMKRVMMFSSFADCAPDLRRWTVKVTDERRRPVFTVLFPAYFVPRGWKPVLVSGARALKDISTGMQVVDMSRVRVPAPPRSALKHVEPCERVKDGQPLGGRGAITALTRVPGVLPHSMPSARRFPPPWTTEETDLLRPSATPKRAKAQDRQRPPMEEADSP